MWQWLVTTADSLGLSAAAVVWTLAIGVLLSLLSVGLVTLLIIYLPANYFLDRTERNLWVDQHPVVRWILIALKNAIGVVLVVVGFLMLFGPGQGLLTILIGVMLLDFPGKRKLELRVLSQPKVYAAINRVRARFGRPPILLPRTLAHPAEEPESPGGDSDPGRRLVAAPRETPALAGPERQQVQED